VFESQRLLFSFSFLFDVSQHKLKHIRLSAQSAATSHALRERERKGEREEEKKTRQVKEHTYRLFSDASH
jgi:hypothetical protein